MAFGINKVILVGHVGRDPEVRYTQNGSPVANFSIATSETWKDKQSGERQEKTEWHNVVAWNRAAEVIGEYVKKGSKLYIEGKLQTRNFEKDGQTHYRTEILALSFQFLDSRGEASGRPEPDRSRPAPAQQSLPDDGFDDDIPF